MKNILVRLIGYLATVIHGDTAVFDRWMWLRRNLKSGNLRTLDAGCGSGAFTMYAAKIGNEAVGISFDEKNNKIAEERANILKIKKVNFIIGDLRRLDKMKNKIGKFDQIICFETIEHILNDQKLLYDFFNLLNPGGKLFLTAPYKYYYKHLLGDDKAGLSTYEDGGHVRWGYTHEEIENLFNKAGLIVEKKEYVSGIISQLLIVLYRFLVINVNHKIAWLVIFPLRIFVIFDSLITNLFKFSYLSIAIIGIKKI
ncbi:methyltransferase domain-containing protein [Candidatus Wolfebacteria bacterium]|nr:methyltransferase domain-containing protein [Candidatus Wolfebacteria bacterium]